MQRTLKSTMIAIGLVGLAIAMTSPAVAGGGRDFGHRGDRAGRLPLEHMAKTLDLTDAQTTQLKSLQDATVRAAIELDGKAEYSEYELRTLLRSEAPNRAAIFAKIDEIASLRAEKKRLQIAALLDARELLSDEQKAKFGDLMAKRRGRGADGAERPRDRRRRGDRNPGEPSEQL